MHLAARLLALAVIVTSASDAHAADIERPVPKRLRALSADLDAPDPPRVQAAIEALAASRHRYAVDALAAFLRRGQPDALADHALAALGMTGLPGALGVLAEFTHHRRAQVRRQAYRSIARIQDPAANDVLARGLRDSDAGVRGICATALGERRAVDALDLLFLALDRGVPEAAGAIGRVGDARSVVRFHDTIGRLPISVLLSGEEAFLRRADLDEAVKLDIVARLGEVAVPAVKTFLEGLLATLDLRDLPRLRSALAETAQRISVPGRPVPR